MVVTREDIERLILECRVTSCFDCGKCTASCPLSELYGDATYGHTPRGIIEYLNLRRPIYKETARHGHFGRHLETFTWERTDKAETLKKAAGL